MFFFISLKIVQDVPKYMMVAGERAVLRGLNLEGLRRNGFTAAEVLINQCFVLIFDIFHFILFNCKSKRALYLWARI